MVVRNSELLLTKDTVAVEMAVDESELPRTKETAEVAVQKPELLLAKNADAVAAAVVEDNRSPEPLQQEDAVPAAFLVSDPHPDNVDSLVHQCRSDNQSAGQLEVRVSFHAVGSL